MKSAIVDLVLATALMSSVKAAAPARAGPPPEAPKGGPFLLENPALQRELKLTPAQVGKVAPALRDLSRNHAADIAALRDLPARDRAVRQRAVLKAMAAELKSALEFTPGQARRFDQIGLQHRRFDAFFDPEVVGRLRLTEAQQLRVAEIARNARPRMQAIVKSSGGNLSSQKQAADLYRELTTRVVALLDADQKATWADLTGPPFDLPADPPPAP